MGERGRWITVNGNHIFLKPGETVDSHFDSKKGLQKNVSETHQYKTAKRSRGNSYRRKPKLKEGEESYVRREVNKWYYDRHKDKHIIHVPLYDMYYGDYNYTIINNGFNDYEIIGKKRIKNKKGQYGQKNKRIP